MIIVGRKSFNKSFDMSVFTGVQEQYRKGKINFVLDSTCCNVWDVFAPINPLMPKNGYNPPYFGIFLGGGNNLFGQIYSALLKKSINLSLVKIDKNFSCIGVDYLDCLKKIDIRDIVRDGLVDMLRVEALSIYPQCEMEQFSKLVSQEGMDNYICKETVIKLYGSYTAETLYKFLSFLAKASFFDIKKKYLPKNTPMEKELIDTLSSGKIYPVVRTSKKTAGKVHTFKGFIPYIMIDNEMQEVFAYDEKILKTGEDLLDSLFSGRLNLASLDPLFSNKGILLEPKTYTGKTFVCEIKS